MENSTSAPWIEDDIIDDPSQQCDESKCLSTGLMPPDGGNPLLFNCYAHGPGTLYPFMCADNYTGVEVANNEFATADDPSLKYFTCCPPVDEPVPLDDDGEPVHDGVAQPSPRSDAPTKCPALRPLSFSGYQAMPYVRHHLEAYRVWRHFSFSPPGTLPTFSHGLGTRRYNGFGRLQFRALAPESSQADCVFVRAWAPSSDLLLLQ